MSDITSAPTPSQATQAVLPAVVVDPEWISMNDYQTANRQTDRMPPDSLDMPLLGLFGEIGSLLSELKKKQRDQRAYIKYDTAVLEELADVLWYFSQLATRAGLTLEVLAQRSFRDLHDWDEVDEAHQGTFGDIQSATLPSRRS